MPICPDGPPANVVSINYPQVTISLPPGATYFLQEAATGSIEAPHSHSEQYADGYAYTDCAYETLTF